jgi:hypothetical protein
MAKKIHVAAAAMSHPCAACRPFVELRRGATACAKFSDSTQSGLSRWLNRPTLIGVSAPKPSPLNVRFDAGTTGNWRIESIAAVMGETLAPAPWLKVTTAPALALQSMGEAVPWSLTGFTSNMRYTERPERDALDARSAGLDRPQAVLAALIPIRKTPAWWALAQDERRAIFEAQSHHIAIGMDYLPGVARRLHHCRDIGGPFDFLTWFEYAPADEAAFDAMLARLRTTPEWDFVDREVDVRLCREVTAA